MKRCNRQTSGGLEAPSLPPPRLPLVRLMLTKQIPSPWRSAFFMPLPHSLPVCPLILFLSLFSHINLIPFHVFLQQLNQSGRRAKVNKCNAFPFRNKFYFNTWCAVWLVPISVPGRDVVWLLWKHPRPLLYHCFVFFSLFSYFFICHARAYCAAWSQSDEANGDQKQGIKGNKISLAWKDKAAII